MQKIDRVNLFTIAVFFNFSKAFDYAYHLFSQITLWLWPQPNIINAAIKEKDAIMIKKHNFIYVDIAGNQLHEWLLVIEWVYHKVLS